MAYLGKGSYGMVVVQDGSAVKKFKKLSHLVQEYAAMRYLENTGVTVRAEGINFRQKKLADERSLKLEAKAYIQKGDGYYILPNPDYKSALKAYQSAFELDSTDSHVRERIKACLEKL